MRASRARKMNSIRVEFADGRSDLGQCDQDESTLNRRGPRNCPFRDVVPT